MRLGQRAGILIAFLFLIPSSALAERIQNDQFGFSVTIPDGFKREPEVESQGQRYLYVYRNTDMAGPGDVIAIQHLGGVIGRDHPGAGGKLPGHADAVFTRPWRNFSVDVAEVPESVGGVATITYNVQVPLKPEAIQLTVVGVREHKEALLADVQYLLRNLDGHSNWVRTFMPSIPASENRNRTLMLVISVAFIGAGLAGAWLVARRKPVLAIVIAVACYTISWLIPTEDVAELYLATGLLRFTGFLGFVIGMLYLAKLKRAERSAAQEAPGKENALQQGLLIALQCSWFWQLPFYLYKPNVEVEGKTYNAAWGKFELPLEPGRYRLRIYFPYFLKPECGMASTEIHVDENRVTRMRYRVPFTIFQPGTLKSDDE